MKTFLTPLTILALLIAGATIAVLTAGGGGSGATAEDAAPIRSEADGGSETCLFGFNPCADDPLFPDGLPPLADDPACDPVPLRSDCGIDPIECNLVHNITACEGDAVDPLFPDGPPQDGLPPLAGDPACDPVPLRSDCGIDPNECNLVHNITACGGETVDPGIPVTEPSGDLPSTMPVPVDQVACEVNACPDMIVEPGSPGELVSYEVTVQFNTSVMQEDIEDAADILRAFDADLEFLIQESFPPTGRAFLGTDSPEFCPSIEAELGTLSYVDGVTCQLFQPVNSAPLDDAVVQVAPAPVSAPSD